MDLLKYHVPFVHRLGVITLNAVYPLNHLDIKYIYCGTTIGNIYSRSLQHHIYDIIA